MDESRRRAIELGYRLSDWSGLTGMQCLYCGEFHIDRAHPFGKRKQARKAFEELHAMCVNPLAHTAPLHDAATAEGQK